MKGRASHRSRAHKGVTWSVSTDPQGKSEADPRISLGAELTWVPRPSINGENARWVAKQGSGEFSSDGKTQTDKHVPGLESKDKLEECLHW